MKRNDYSVNVNNSTITIVGTKGGFYSSGNYRYNGTVIVDAPCEVETFTQDSETQ